MNLIFHITLQKPPANVDFALQKGSGSKYETVQMQRSDLNDLHFQFSIEIKGEPVKDQLPDFKGPFVQGPVTGRFVYIDIGEYAGGAGPWNRKLKIPLTSITWDLIARANTNLGYVLKTHVPGTGTDGAPNCGTVKPFEGWGDKKSVTW